MSLDQRDGAGVDGGVGVSERAFTAVREHQLLAAFVQLVGGLTSDFDVHERLHTLAEHCLSLARVEACGVLLVDGDGPLGLVAAVPYENRLLDVFQLQSRQGPCLECVRTGQPVRSRDLVADAHRWPVWSKVALDHGFRTAYATPIRAGDRTIGTLNLFGREPIGLADDDLLLIRALADVAAVTILRHRSLSDAVTVNEQLQHALQSRVQVEQAKGIVAQCLSVPMDVAFEIIRSSSRGTNTKLGVVCAALIDSKIQPIDLVPPIRR